MVNNAFLKYYAYKPYFPRRFGPRGGLNQVSGPTVCLKVCHGHSKLRTVMKKGGAGPRRVVDAQFQGVVGGGGGVIIVRLSVVLFHPSHVRL